MYEYRKMINNMTVLSIKKQAGKIHLASIFNPRLTGEGDV